MQGAWWVGPDELNEEQRNVLSLPLDDDFLIKGPPGSGKTNLLLLRGNYLYRAGQQNIAILVFTRTLRNFIASGADQYAFPNDLVQTSRKWAQTLLFEYGYRPEFPEKFDEQRAYVIDCLNQLMREQNVECVYDAILLDEAQDYLPEEIAIFRRLARRVFAVADSRQKIYEGHDGLSELEKQVECFRLHYHYRNGLKICRFADGLARDVADYEPLEATCNYDETARPSSVDHVECKDLQEQSTRIIDSLGVQLKAYPGEMIGVVSPRKSEVEILWEQIYAAGFGDISVLQLGGEHADFRDDTRICVATCHAVKGLEFRALHFAGCEYLKKFRHQRRLAYMAATRAKTSLSIYYSGRLPGYFQGAIAQMNPATQLPDLSDIFGGAQ